MHVAERTRKGLQTLDLQLLLRLLNQGRAGRDLANGAKRLACIVGALTTCGVLIACCTLADSCNRIEKVEAHTFDVVKKATAEPPPRMLHGKQL